MSKLTNQLKGLSVIVRHFELLCDIFTRPDVRDDPMSPWLQKAIEQFFARWVQGYGVFSFGGSEGQDAMELAALVAHHFRQLLIALSNLVPCCQRELLHAHSMYGVLCRCILLPDS